MRRALARVLCAALLAACSAPPPPEGARPVDAAAPAPASASASTPAAPAASASPSASTAASAPASASASAAPTTEPAAPERADNQVKPISDDDLQTRARALLDAIAKDAPEVAEPFWFPKPPFIPLKDIKDPGKYWDQLHRAYANDVHALHAKRKSWDGAKFTGFEIGSAPKWVKPGEEANTIGYYRSFDGELHFDVDGAPTSLKVHVLITWQGHWYVTHLLKVKH